jgi:oligopeptide transport system permease protein
MSVALINPPVPAGAAAVDEIEEGHSLWQDAWARLRKNRLAVISGIVLIVVSLFCLIGPWFTPAPDVQDLALYATPPSASHWLGTDTLGRDLLARVLTGGRLSFAVGLCATLVSLIIGVIYGTIAGYYGGKIDNLMMRIVDIIYAFPFTIFVILLMVLFHRSLLLLFAAIGAVEWLNMARIVRGQVLTLRKMEFIEAADALGIPKSRIIFRHLIPNVLGPVIVYTTLTIPAVMLLEAFLSFLGLGVQPPDASWGVLINEGSKSMEEFWWMLVFPGLALSITLFSLNFLGDGLRDALDPKTSKD